MPRIYLPLNIQEGIFNFVQYLNLKSIFSGYLVNIIFFDNKKHSIKLKCILKIIFDIDISIYINVNQFV